MTKPITLFGAIILAFLLSCGSNHDEECPSATCADYATQEAAQAAYNADPHCLKELDNDHDGIPCEHLPTAPGTNPGTDCPATSNCGCSDKTKAQCESKCCKWIVGTGCRCK